MLSKKFLGYLFGAFTVIGIILAAALPGDFPTRSGAFLFAVLVPVIGVAVVAIIWLLVFLLLFVHEAGHWIVATNYGFEVRQVKVAGIYLVGNPRDDSEQRGFEFMGHVAFNPPTIADYRRRFINIVWGGQVASILLTVGLLLLTCCMYLGKHPDGVIIVGTLAVGSLSLIVSGFSESLGRGYAGDFQLIRAYRNPSLTEAQIAYAHLVSCTRHGVLLHDIAEDFLLAATAKEALEPEYRAAMLN